MKKICSKCGQTIKYNQTCTCKVNTSYNRNITPEKRKFYSSYAWQKLRNRKVKEHPYCERCWSKYKIITTEKLQGHHIKSFKDYPELRLDEDNVAMLCRGCNLQVVVLLQKTALVIHGLSLVLIQINSKNNKFKFVKENY